MARTSRRSRAQDEVKKLAASQNVMVLAERKQAAAHESHRVIAIDPKSNDFSDIFNTGGRPLAMQFAREIIYFCLLHVRYVNIQFISLSNEA